MAKKRFFDLKRELDRLLEASPTPKTALSVNRLAKHDALYSYAFSRLSNPAWLPLLAELGRFKSPPHPKKTPGGTSLTFPLWPESQFLLRIAPQAPDDVAALIKRMKPTTNVRVLEDLVGILAVLPPSTSKGFVNKVKRWLTTPYYLQLPNRLGLLITSLAKGSFAAEALDLTRTALKVLPDPSPPKEVNSQPEWTLPPNPRTRLDIWQYKEFVEEHRPALLTAGGLQTVVMFLDLLNDAIRLSQRKGTRNAPNDFSYIWRPSLERESEIHAQDLKSVLLSCAMWCTDQAIKNNQVTTNTITPTLLSYPWHAFTRIALHALRLHAPSTDSLTRRLLLDSKHFDQLGLEPEYSQLLSKAFTSFPHNARRRILRRIAKGPDIPLFRNWHREFHGKEPTSEEIHEHVASWKARALSPIRKLLTKSEARGFSNIPEDQGKGIKQTRKSHKVGWVAPHSPKSSEDLLKTPDEDLASYLSSLPPLSTEEGAATEGLARELQTAVSQAPHRFSANATHFQELHSTYLTSIAMGLNESLRRGSTITWDDTLKLCLHACNKSSPTLFSSPEDSDSSSRWRSTRKAIADLIGTGLDEIPGELPVSHRSEVWDIITQLTNDPDPSPGSEKTSQHSASDHATRAINTVRGQALHTVVRFALWSERHKDLIGHNDPHSWDSPEGPKSVLEEHLKIPRDPSLAIRSIYGQWFPWLVMLDAEWCKSNVSNIFPRKHSLSKWRDAAWTTYLTFCAPYDSVFHILKNEYSHEVQRTQKSTLHHRGLEDPCRRLTEHLIVFYGRGLINLNTPKESLSSCFDELPPDSRAYMFEFIGKSLADDSKPPPSPIVERLQALWEHRFAALLQAGKRRRLPLKELAGIGYWTSPALDHMWLVLQFKKALELAGTIANESGVIEYLARVSHLAPNETLECLNLIIQKRDEYRGRSWRTHVSTIVKSALASPEEHTRTSGIEAIHRLGEEGHLEFEALLPAQAHK